MYDEPVVLAMMGQGFPIFHYPVHVAQTDLPSEAPLYTRQEVLILHNKYSGRAWVNQALVDEGDNGLRSEVHCYRSLMDEADRKERELSTIQDCLMDISMDLQYMQTCNASQRLKLSSNSKTGGSEQGMASSSTHGNSNKGVLPEGGAVSRPLPWWDLRRRGYV